MKLKKLLAAVTAAALAVTTMAVTSFTASADGEVEFGKTSAIAAKSVRVDYSISSDANDGEYKYGNVNIIVKTWNNDADTGDYLENGIGGSEQAQWFNSPTKQWVATFEGTRIDSAFTVDLTEYDTLDELAILYAPHEHYDFAISSVKAYSGAGGTGEVVWSKDGTPLPQPDPTGTWIKKSAGVYYLKAEAAGTNPNYATGAAKPAPMKIPYEEILAAGKTVADVKSVTATVETDGIKGCLYGKISDENVQKEWSKDAASVTLENADDFSVVEFQVWYANFGAECTVTFTLEYKDGGDTPLYNLTPSTATIETGDYQIFTLEGYDGQEQPTWEIDETYVDVLTTGVDVDNNQCKLIGKAATDPTTALTVKLGNKTVGTAVITVVEGDTPPTIPEGTKVTLNDNPPYNWQSVNNVTIPGITNWTTTVAEAKEKLDSVTFTFNVNGALSNGTEFDVSKLGFQGVIQTNDTEGLWKTYDATVSGSKVTITMTDIGAAFGDKTGAVNFAVAINTAYDNAEDPVDVYISEIKVDVKAPDEGGDDPNPPTPPVTGDKTFEGETTITCDNYWGQTTVTLEQLIGDLDPAKTTVVFTGEFINKIGYNSVSQTPTADGSKWREIEAANGKITLDASDLVTDGFYFVIAAGKESGDATISWVATEKGNKPDEPDQPDPPTPPVTTDAIWEGSTDMGTDWSANVQIPAAKFAEIKAGDTLKYTFTCEPDAQIKIMSMAEGWPAIPGPDPDPEWGTVNISGTSFSFVLTDADVTALKEFGMAVSGKNYTLTKVELVPKSEPNPPVDPGHTHTPATAWTSDATGHWYACAGCDEKLSFAAHTSDGGIITTPATDTTAGTKTYKCTVCGYVIKTETIPATGGSSSGGSLGGSSYGEYTGGTVIPSQNGVSKNTPNISGDSGRSGWQVISAEIIVASDGDKIEVDMNNVTKVPSTIFKDIEGKDVDLVFNMGRGIKWTVNGLSVTSHKNVDFDVTKNTRHIPSETVDKAEGSYKKQISLDHRGSFGCAATLTYDIGAKYNGLYANIFYYNPKTEELELVDCSLISGGKANFMFTHASDYLITVTDEPLGEFEDVSSAAGIASDDNSIGSGIAVSAVLAAVVLGFGIVVYRKRRHN